MPTWLYMSQTTKRACKQKGEIHACRGHSIQSLYLRNAHALAKSSTLASSRCLSLAGPLCLARLARSCYDIDILSFSLQQETHVSETPLQIFCLPRQQGRDDTTTSQIVLTYSFCRNIHNVLTCWPESWIRKGFQ